jgi:dTDP-4-dehydrorhamnose reductase
VKVLLTGSSGQLGQALLASVPADVEIVAPQRKALDLSDAASIAKVLTAERPDVLINAGAYTAVDKAESEPEQAFTVNAAAPGVMARWCGQSGSRLVHVSTDFVFDGRQSTPYRPQDPTQPLNVYGASKLKGEREIMAVKDLDWRIIRTAWVYAARGRNFMLTMLRLFEERPVVNVVSDQIGTPTSAASLAQCVWRAVVDQGGPGVLHYTDAGTASWYDFAVAIYEEARALGLVSKDVDIVPIGSEQYPTPARRPSYSVLDKRDTLARLQLPVLHWRAALRKVLLEIKR